MLIPAPEAKAGIARGRGKARVQLSQLFNDSFGIRYPKVFQLVLELVPSLTPSFAEICYNSLRMKSNYIPFD